MTVYAVNMVSDELTDAERFGPIKYINHRYIFGDEIQDDQRLPREPIHHMRRCADEFDPDQDYLLIVGDHLQLVAFVAELSVRLDEFMVLRWDRIQKAYFPVKIDTRP